MSLLDLRDEATAGEGAGIPAVGEEVEEHLFHPSRRHNSRQAVEVAQPPVHPGIRGDARAGARAPPFSLARSTAASSADTD